MATLLLARPAVRIYLGADWDPVATILIILAPMMAGRFLFLAVAAAPLVTGRTGWLLAANASLAAATLGTYVVARVQGLGMEHYLSLYSLVTSLLYAMLVAAITLAVFRLDRRVIAQET